MRIMAAFFGGGIVQYNSPRPFGLHGVFFGDIVVLVPTSGADLSRQGCHFLLG